MLNLNNNYENTLNFMMKYYEIRKSNYFFKYYL
jgi:hypothetical protein